MEHISDTFQPDFEYIVPESITATFDKMDLHTLRFQAKQLCESSEVIVTYDIYQLDRKQMITLCSQLFIFYNYIIVKEDLGY